MMAHLLVASAQHAASHGGPHHLTWPEAIVIGLLQGISELFPVSSLGHSVLIPALVGGSWARDLDVAAPESPYLAFIVGLHVATAFALIAYFWRDWVRIVRGLLTSIRDRRVETPDQRLAWLLVLATIPVGLVGLVFEHTFRVRFGTPTAAAAFLAVNGLILLGVEQLKKRAPDDDAVDRAADEADAEGGQARSVAIDERLAQQSVLGAVVIGAAQILALFSGLSRSGATISAGLLKGMRHEDAARFAFLLATPVILAAGVLKLPDLTGPLGKGIGGQVLVGSLLSFVGAYVSVRFLDRYFQRFSLRPFGIYCLAAGIGCSIYFAVR